MGKFEEANRHYAIAFERMPEQFGQVASFCFGCQGVFEKEQSRSVAEQVLTRLAEAQAQRPQVHFLLGQLRAAQCRYADAYRSFKRAVELDPDYLDAWSHLNGLVEELYLPKKERDDVVFRGMELDPEKRYFRGRRDTVADMRRFWTLAARGVRNEKPVGMVFELKGTAQAIAKERAGAAGLGGSTRMRYSHRRYRDDREAGAPPAVLLIEHEMVRALDPYLQ
jgi:tetratricopeptide (TPR) repeat protein